MYAHTKPFKILELQTCKLWFYPKLTMVFPKSKFLAIIFKGVPLSSRVPTFYTSMSKICILWMILPRTYEEILEIFQVVGRGVPTSALWMCDVVILQCEVGGVLFTTHLTDQMHVTITNKIYVLNRLIWLCLLQTMGTEFKISYKYKYLHTMQR